MVAKILEGWSPHFWKDGHETLEGWARNFEGVYNNFCKDGHEKYWRDGHQHFQKDGHEHFGGWSPNLGGIGMTF